MRVLVTGGSGFLGRHVVRILRERGDDVRVVDLVAHPDPEVDCVVGDLRDPDVVARVADADLDAIVHLAAITSVIKSREHPDEVVATNITALGYLLEACRTTPVGRFVFASSNAVVGNVGVSEIDERLALSPLTPYGGTKAAGEMLLSAYSHSYGIVGISLRFTNIYGVGMQLKDSVVARLMRAALDGGGIDIYGDGEQLRDYLYVTDATRAILFGLDYPSADLFTIGAGESVSMNVLHALAVKATGVAIGATHIEAKPGEMPAVIVKTDKVQAAGFRCEVGLAEGLKATWDDFRERA